MNYIATFIIAPGKTHTSKHVNAPKTEWLLEDGKKHGAQFVVRFWPTRKGWRILDMRNAQSWMQTGRNGTWEQYHIWRGHEWSERVYPNEDAAVMHAMTMLGVLLT